jgi:hypothetical protein
MTAHAAMTAHTGMAAHSSMAGDALWPWAMGPLGSGAVAAWLLAFAVAVGLCVADGDLARLRIETRAYTVFGALQLVNVLRFGGEVTWSSPSAWVFVLMAAAVTATGTVGWVLSRRVTPARVGARAADRAPAMGEARHAEPVPCA